MRKFIRNLWWPGPLTRSLLRKLKTPFSVQTFLSMVTKIQIIQSSNKNLFHELYSFGLVDNCINRIKVFYKSPIAKITINGFSSDLFALRRATSETVESGSVTTEHLLAPLLVSLIIITISLIIGLLIVSFIFSPIIVLFFVISLIIIIVYLT